jgi:hypothetical protein
VGCTTFITGPGKGCGKTTVFKAALAALRRARGGGCGAEGEIAYLAVGLGGHRLDGLTGEERPRIRALPGEILLTAEPFLRATSARFEILGLLPESGALGRPALVRVLRTGDAILAGPDRNENLELALTMAREAGARSMLVDGALNRITQLASGTSRFLFSILASRGDLEKQCSAMRRLALLVSLPRYEEAGSVEVGSADSSGQPGREGLGSDEHGGPAVASHDGSARCAQPEAADARSRGSSRPEPGRDADAPFFIDGALTAEVAESISAGRGPVVVGDFTKIFLEWQALRSLRGRRPLAVQRSPEFAGFVVTLRNLERSRFLDALGDPSLEPMIGFNPWELEEPGDPAKSAEVDAGLPEHPMYPGEPEHSIPERKEDFRV